MSQFAPKRIFNTLNSCELDPFDHKVNGHGSCVIANGTISPPATPSIDFVSVCACMYAMNVYILWSEIFLFSHSLQECLDHPDSPGIFRTQSYDAVLFDIRKVSAEKLAVSV